jgi:hypothetical protein
MTGWGKDSKCALREKREAAASDSCQFSFVQIAQKFFATKTRNQKNTKFTINPFRIFVLSGFRD